MTNALRIVGVTLWALCWVGWASPAQAEKDRSELRWDHQGRVSSVTSGTHRAGYFYAEGVDRVLEEHDGSMTYYIGPNFEVRDGVAVVYARDGWRRLARRSQSTLQAGLLPDLAPSGTPGARLDVGDAWLFGRGTNDASRAAKEPTRHLYASARRLLLEQAGGVALLHQDHAGSQTLATDVEGTRLGERKFHPTGQLLVRVGYVDEHGFTGMRGDPASGFEHFQFRELDRRLGRWVSPDPWFLTDGQACVERPFECANGFQYVMNNPVDLFDPTGKVGWNVLRLYHHQPATDDLPADSQTLTVAVRLPWSSWARTVGEGFGAAPIWIRASDVEGRFDALPVPPGYQREVQEAVVSLSTLWRLRSAIARYAAYREVHGDEAALPHRALLVERLHAISRYPNMRGLRRLGMPGRTTAVVAVHE
ncbi:MAG: RHS repeat-associated core domain-containing protein [Myxococcales bacterium]